VHDGPDVEGAGLLGSEQIRGVVLVPADARVRVVQELHVVQDLPAARVVVDPELLQKRTPLFLFEHSVVLLVQELVELELDLVLRAAVLAPGRADRNAPRVVRAAVDG
jgi:hypothetical protein